ncbi:hypothetical protein [Oceanirhabdus seepicola]|uniref:Uncharacterized protein n=1 Tax=Oceanirhabdus seepicola TaxID=2828781 RepID=A0A9J6P6C5_9CLOT|nr:hypothetical protein [Oceanirhabdus seepicola]MCM1991349.1 hypothetical protein [Oceanirhabdus seepicola]
MEQLEKQTLYIPQGIKAKTEIFDGFGKEELFQAILATVVAGVIDAIVYMFTKSTTFCGGH